MKSPNTSNFANLADQQRFELPELLAPAGDWDCVRAAVENGADAIYFGLSRFNARMRAKNFTETDLPKLMEFLGRRGVKAYVTLNTLVFENELEDAEKQLRAIINAGADAVIVQDVGICRLIRSISPDFPIHASTQMTVTSAAGASFAESIGCSLVVLARECSISEIEKIQTSLRQCAPAQAPTIPLEVFVHGALCVAYSGQCLTSEALGGRSANRGECAQACRMPYDLVADGKTVSMGDRRYLLSPQDLAGLDGLPDLIRTGVASIKIEGRLKTPEYVANVTRIYRQELDRLACRSESQDRKLPKDSLQLENQYEMEMAFSRGLYSGWLYGIDNQRLVHARFGKKRGAYLGEVTAVLKEGVILAAECSIKPGDGIVFDSGNPGGDEEGGRVYSVAAKNSGVELRFGRGQIALDRVHVRDRVWKTSDPALDRRIRQTFSGDQPHFRRPIHFAVFGKVGEPLVLIARDDQGHEVSVNSIITLELANKCPLSNGLLEEQLGRLGGTPFKLGTLDNQTEGGVILPVGELNRMRRDAVQKLEALKVFPTKWTVNPRATIVSDLRESGIKVADAASFSPHSIELIVLVRTMPQLQAALRREIKILYCEFENPKAYREAVQIVRNWKSPRSENGDSVRPAIFVAPPRIFKPGDDWILKQVRSSEADGYLVRNYDHLTNFKDSRCVGDFSLNITNSLSAECFKTQFHLERLTASYDLNASQLGNLLKAAPRGWFEISIHQHMPMFHMEHCVFCAFLSNGTDYRNCGRPCDTRDVKLKDRVGLEHPVRADAGCRNTVFSALAQTGAEHITQLIALGARHFRIEFLNEEPSIVERTIDSYRSLIHGQITGTRLWKELKLLNQLGVTRGQM
ncbi:MAG: DUF3656 domain-containing protein [Verrucomicrobia bacterium]|nr:DUF3656 domain-containing protein [Verrucomicrobiota bacterium]